MVFATVHPQSVGAFFGAARERARCSMIAGKVMMDRNCPEFMRDTAQSSYDDCKALIARWHGMDRLLYAVTPRFAPTSTERQLELAGRLLDEHPGVYLQSHVAENLAEVAWAAELFPWSRSYLDVYDHFGLVRERSDLRALHPSRRRRPRANGRVGRGDVVLPHVEPVPRQRSLRPRRRAPARCAGRLGTDVGGGTSFIDAAHTGRGVQGRAIGRPPADAAVARSIMRRSAARDRSTSTTGSAISPTARGRLHRARSGGHAADRAQDEARADVAGATLRVDDAEATIARSRRPI